MDLNLRGKTAVVTGAGGAICGEIAKALALEGADVAIWDISLDAATRKCREILAIKGKAIPVQCNVLNKEEVKTALEATMDEYGNIDILINGAGGSRKEATTSIDLEFFDIGQEALNDVLMLNYMSAVIPCQAVGKIFAENKEGVIINISSIAGILPLTRAIGYSNGKAATTNFTKWLAVHMAKNYSPRIRVNAIAPGFILTEQNRFLLEDEKKGGLTERGKTIIKYVPMARLGEPKEIAGTALWLVSDSASFVTGAVIIVDGGFTAFSGV